MSLEGVTDDLEVLLPPMLRLLESMTRMARHYAPGRLAAWVGALAADGTVLKTEMGRLDLWPKELDDLANDLRLAAQALSAALECLQPPVLQPPALDADMTDEFKALRRALRHSHQAREVIYPMSHWLTPVSAFFLPQSARASPDVLACQEARPGPDRGLLHAQNTTRERGGVSIYVSERYDAGTPAPLIVALHGGGGHGRDFLWSWLPAARLFGAILICPTSIGSTWPIFDEEPDRSRVLTLLERAQEQWSIDPHRMLLTGMSDGGTFSYVLGLSADSPFSHLAPVAASFHPMLAQAADPSRLGGLPIHVVHGRYDWMFPVDMAHMARDSLTAAGADVTYTEVPDLGHAYPPEVNTILLDWLSFSRKH